MCAVRKPPRRSKAATLATLKRDLGKEKIGHIDRHKLIEYRHMRLAMLQPRQLCARQKFDRDLRMRQMEPADGRHHQRRDTRERRHDKRPRKRPGLAARPPGQIAEHLVGAGLFPIVYGGAAATLPPELAAMPTRVAHGVIATILVALIALHIAAALYHQVAQKDGLVRRMWFGKRSA
jgi:hypothetical protein